MRTPVRLAGPILLLCLSLGCGPGTAILVGVLIAAPGSRGDGGAQPFEEVLLVSATFSDESRNTAIDSADIITVRFSGRVEIIGTPLANNIFAVIPAGSFGPSAIVTPGPQTDEVLMVNLAGGSFQPNGTQGSDPGSSGFNVRPGQSELTDRRGTPISPLGTALDLGGELNPYVDKVVHNDINGSCTVDLGDRLEITFTTDVNVNTPNPATVFQLPVSGDTFGGGAQIVSGTPQGVRTVEVDLGSMPILTLGGVFDPLVRGPGSPSGLDIATSTSGWIVDATYSRVDGVPREPPGVDISRPPSTALAPVWTVTTQGSPPSNLGEAACSAGDVNMDGYPDVIVSDTFTTSPAPTSGEVYAYFGGPSGLPTTPDWISTGDGQGGAHFGTSVACAGDVNRDGYDDLVVGAPPYDTSELRAGKAYVYPGGPGGLAATPLWTSSGDDQADATFGHPVASAGDVNGDGYSDILVGAPLFDTGQADAGKAYLFLGGPGGPSSTPAWTSSGDDQAGARFGLPLGLAGDVNGDGYSDVIVSAFLYNTSSVDVGRAYVYLGMPGGLSVTPVWTSSGDDQADSRFGQSAASAGDVDGDGLFDVLVGSTDFDSTSTDAGRVYLYLGAPGGPLTAPDWVSDGEGTPFAGFGHSLCTVGDVTNDGFPDILVGAPGSVTEIGKVFIYSICPP